MKAELNFLHLEDNDNDYELILSRLQEAGLPCSLDRVKTREGFAAAIERGGFDLVLSDFSIPGFDGLKALAMAREKFPQVPFLFVSGTLGEEVAIDTLRAGATDYVLKDRLSRLAPAVRRALAETDERLARRRAEEAMIQSEFKYRHLFECLGDAAFLLDPATERVLDTNKEAERLLDRTRAEIIGLHQPQFHSPLTLEESRRRFADAANQASRLSFEGEVLAKDGRTIPVTITAAPITLHQRLLILGLYSDLTGRKQLEKQLRQSQKMEAIGQLASGIAHDINNSISPVLGFTELLLQGSYGLNPKGREYVQLIATAGHDIARIVARLGEFYRPRNGRESLQQVNLNHLVEQVLGLTRPRWRDVPQSRGLTIEMRTDFAANLPTVSAIESEVRGVLTNLLLNAVDALPGGGQIICRTRVSYSAPAKPGETGPAHVILEISDTGIGMNEDTRKRCLEPFFSTKGKHGTGLGLAMVHGAMERHEGRIEIESQPGKGTLFRLAFPIRQPALAAARPAAIPAASEQRHILYIDDEPLLRELLKELLELDGHQVEVCDGGKAGLRAFRSAHGRGQPFDIVITDLGMPYLSGREVARLIKHESPTTPVALLTGWAALINEEGALSDQVDAILTKPPSLDELRRFLCSLPTPAGRTEHTPRSGLALGATHS